MTHKSLRSIRAFFTQLTVLHNGPTSKILCFMLFSRPDTFSWVFQSLTRCQESLCRGVQKFRRLGCSGTSTTLTKSLDLDDYHRPDTHVDAGSLVWTPGPPSRRRPCIHLQRKLQTQTIIMQTTPTTSPVKRWLHVKMKLF